VAAVRAPVPGPDGDYAVTACFWPLAAVAPRRFVAAGVRRSVVLRVMMAPVIPVGMSTQPVS